MNIAEEYDELQRQDVRVAFTRAYQDIEKEQSLLRKVNPLNPFLGVVKLRSSCDGLDFAKNFRGLVLEHTPDSQSRNLYFFLGRYVELLRREQTPEAAYPQK